MFYMCKKRFEYKQVNLRFNSGDTLIDILNREGEDGWEYVNKDNLEEPIGSNGFLSLTGVRIIFKREKNKEE